MIRKIIILLIATFALNFNAVAGTDGELILKKNQPSDIKDCSEKFNRATFAFNQALDGAIIKPLASAYNILPIPIRTGVGNSMDNLSNLITIPNNILQGDLKKASINTGRLIINTTLGIFGIFDVAELMGFSEYEKEDYGQTLAKHGVGPGCYIVLPILGPSTTRDAISSVANFMGGDPWYNVSIKNETQYFSEIDYYASKVTTGVDFRAKNYDAIENLEENSLDFYASVKSLYLQDRQQKILNTKKTINNQNDSDWEEIDN